MDNEKLNSNLGKNSVRPFDSKPKESKDLLTTLLSSSTFTIALGMLLTGTGVICFVPFHNKFSKFMLLAGMVIAFSGFALKLLDICLKFIGGRS